MASPVSPSTGDYVGDLPNPINDKKFGGAGFPSMFTDPAEKRKKPYCLSTTEAIYYRSWSAWNSPFGNLDRNKLIDNASWANGQFDVQAFMGGKNPENSVDQNPLLKNLDFDPVTEGPKIMDIVVGYMEALNYSVTATAINPAGGAQKENARIKALADLKMQPFARQVNQAAGAPIMPKPQFPFKTEQELNTYFQLRGFKLIAELQIEVGNKIVMNDSDWKSLKKLLCEDAVKNGRIAVDVISDRNGRLRYKYVDTVNCGIEDFRGHNLTQPSKIWYTEVLTVQEILLDAANCGTPFTDQEAMTLAKRYENKYNNPSWSAAEGVARQYVNTDTSLGFFWYQWKVPVMKTYWEELDVYKTATVTKAGKQATMPTNYMDETKVYYDNSKPGRPPEERKREVKTIYIHNYYQSKWIPGTSFLWDYGPVPFQARDPYDIKRALCPLKYYRINTQSHMERIKGLLKKEYMAWLKLDQEVSNAKPFGWKINTAALESISLGQNKTFTVEMAIEVWNQTGNLIYRDEALADAYGKTKGKDPMLPIEQQGVLEAIQRWIALINFYKMRIADITGINEFMDASNPNSNTPATVAKAAIAGSKNSMSQLTSAIRNMQEKLALDTSARLQLIVKQFGEYQSESGEVSTGYVNPMGGGLMKLAGVGQAILGYTYGIQVDAMPDEEEKKAMKDAIYQAFASVATPEQGGLWVDSVLEFNEMIDGGVPMKIVRLLMQARQQEALDKLQEQRQQLLAQQSAANAQMEQGKAQSAFQQLQAESQLRMQEEEHLTGEINKRNAALVNDKTIGKIVGDTHKSGLKIQEKAFDNATV